MVFQNPRGWGGGSTAGQSPPAHLIALVASTKITPIIDDPDIWRAANLLLKRHSTDAETVAAMRADELLATGDVEGCLVWKRILAAITELSRTAPEEGERVN
jgi:hypothetical protein